MKKDPGQINSPEIEAYAIKHSTQDSRLTTDIIQYTERHSQGSHMICGPLLARLLQILMKITQVKKVLDLGTFTGYSALSMAEALPADGKIISCDQDPRCLEVAEYFFNQSDLKNKLEIHRGEGLHFLETTTEIFDLIFIDADKKRLKLYYEAALQKLKKGGLLVIDDVLWRAEVLAPEKKARAQEINAFNQYLSQDTRITHVLLPVRHGVQLILYSG